MQPRHNTRSTAALARVRQTKDLALHVQTLSQDVNAQKIAPTVDETIDLYDTHTP